LALELRAIVDDAVASGVGERGIVAYGIAVRVPSTQDEEMSRRAVDGRTVKLAALVGDG